MKKALNSSKAPEAVGPYSQAMDTGNIIFFSGQLGVDRETGQLQESIEAQTRQVFKNIQHVLDEADLTMDHIVKVMVLLTDMDNFGIVNEIYGEQFKAPQPARSAFAVKGLPLGADVEIEVIVAKDALSE